ncbi:potassium channel LctB [Bacillus mesophilus]|uniref:potassium channel family protein n=1 Tax=Bacillus mesophilus TaxID=1808955 RepID=UPI001EF961DA|nr:potassium channel family protein [Bacillus mesophilus]MBM7662560.1 potassium channel LctB [Bacillus mesophilus]
MVNLLFLSVIMFSLYKSFSQIFLRQEHRKNYISFENLAFLFLVYVNVLIGFSLVYTIFEMKGIPVLVEGGSILTGGFLEILSSSLYFSAITLLSVGYGDITPIGIGRWFAVLEALIGYIIPAAFVVRSMVDFEQRPN